VAWPAVEAITRAACVAPLVGGHDRSVDEIADDAERPVAALEIGRQAAEVADHAAATRRAAHAAQALVGIVEIGRVVIGQLFVRRDVAQREDDGTAGGQTDPGVRIAGVIGEVVEAAVRQLEGVETHLQRDVEIVAAAPQLVIAHHVAIVVAILVAHHDHAGPERPGGKDAEPTSLGVGDIDRQALAELPAGLFEAGHGSLFPRTRNNPASGSGRALLIRSLRWIKRGPRSKLWTQNSEMGAPINTLLLMSLVVFDSTCR
jgi:hypothetical protein